MLGRQRGSSKINDDAMSANVRQLRPWQEGSSSLKDPPTPLVDKLTAVALAPMGAGNPPGNPASRSPAGARPAATLLSDPWICLYKGPPVRTRGCEHERSVRPTSDEPSADADRPCHRWPIQQWVFLVRKALRKFLVKHSRWYSISRKIVFLVYRKRFAEAAGKFHAKHLRWFTSITGLHNGSIVATLFAISGNHKPAECTTGNCDRASRDLVRRIRWCSRRRCKHSRSRETRRQSFGLRSRKR